MEADVLIIDEISMISASLLDLISDVGKAVRNSNKPFGGVQMILVGDFYQLPVSIFLMNVINDIHSQYSTRNRQK